MALKTNRAATPAKPAPTATVMPKAPPPPPPQPQRETMQEAAERVVTEDSFLSDGAGSGREGVDRNAFAIPFIGVLQGLSPMVQQGTPAYVTDARPGLLFDTVSKELYEEIEVTVVATSHTMCSWTPRDAGGGFLGEVPWTPEVDEWFRSVPQDDKGRRIQDNKEYTEHRNFLCKLWHDDGRPAEPVIISMTKSQLEVSRRWFNMLEKLSFRMPGQLPNYNSEIWRIYTVIKTKNNNTWHKFEFAHLRRVNQLQYNEVKEAKQLALTGPQVRQLEHIEPEGTETEV